MLAVYEKMIAAVPGVEQKGANMPYTSVNGHMFSYIGEDNTIALRLAEGDREEFMEKFSATLAEAHGVVMKEYVAIPDSAHKKTSELKKFFARSYDYVSGLKPKPAAKKK